MKKNPKLVKKLASYSALSVAAIAAGKTAEAQIIYSDVQDIVVPLSFHAPFDLNNDGTMDFDLYMVSQVTSIYSGIVHQARGRANNSNAINAMHTSYYGFNLPYAMNAGDVIGSAAAWQSPSHGSVFQGYQIMATYSTYGSFGYGPWRGKNDKFMGLKLLKGGQTFYGWVRLSVTSDVDTLMIKDYAYNAQKDQPINAGDNGCATLAQFVKALGPDSACAPASLNATPNASVFHYEWQLDGHGIPANQNAVFVATESGDYTVIVTNSAGCIDTSAVHHLTILNPPPTVTASGGTLTSSAATTYQWYKNDTLITGATNSTYNPSAPGSYSVEVDYNNGCGKAKSAGYNFASGIADVQPAESKALVYADDKYIHIHLKDDQLVGCRLVMTNALGQVIVDRLVEKRDDLVDLNTIAAGVYILKLEKAGWSQSSKVTDPQ